MNCPFCKTLVAKSVFADSNNFLAVYNIAPVLPGHSLIIPKRHIESFLDLSDIELSEMMLFARKVTLILLKIFNAEGFNWSVQEKPAAGQTISHMHLHIVPRLQDDLKEPGDWYPKIENNNNEILDSDKRQKLSIEEMKQIVLKLKSASGMDVL